MLERKMFVLDPTLGNISAIRRIKGSPVTIWAASSLFLFIDTFIYSLTVANLPDILQDKMHTSESANGVVTAMFGVGAILGAAIAMMFSDQHSVRRPLQLLGAVFYIVAGVVFYYAEHFYQMVLFRTVNGIASGVACTLLYTAVGDVYPANLLGFKVAIIYFCNNLSYTIGPICGEKLFDTGGIPAIASVVIALGVLEFALVFTVIEDSLVLRGHLQHGKKKSLESVSSDDTDAVALQTLNENTKYAVGTARVSEAPFAQPANVNSMTTVSEEIQSHEQPQSMASPRKMTVWRLVFHIHVLVPTISIIVSIGIQCMLEAVVSLHLADAFNASNKGGITFVIYGLALTILVPVIGKVNDVIIERYGDQMRYYLMLFGSVTSILTITLMALAKSYGVMIFGYVLYAITNLCMCIPAQSAYGDFANYLDSNSMASSYGISTIAWALASGVVCTLLYTTVGDVYPTNLLGFKVAIIHFCNTIAYTIGPICGERIFNTGGIPAIASIVIALGVLGFTVVFTVVEDSLAIRALLQQDKEKPSGSLSSSDPDAVLLQTLDITRTNEAPFAQPVNEHSVATVSEEIRPLELPLVHTTAGLDSVESPPKMTLWRLLLQIHVIVPTISTIVAIGIQCMLESVVPLHLDDTFKGPSKSGITFVIFGLALTVFVPMVGKINDVTIRRYGEKMRYYLMLFGSITSMLTILLMALAKSYGLMMFGYILYAVTNLCMWIPSKSAYGDFVNYLDSNSMATSFGISTIAWSVGAIAFPPIGTALYASVGFPATLIGISLVTCLVCALACLVYPLHERRAYRQT
ncbi:hypothetical protein GGI23_001670 [Coemansia sp. RSA 2559]|nr:hypothetical protein GGI23_001670 [Coemansia sp. RSA 2559]